MVDKVEIGKKYKVIENRDSKWGRCHDNIKIEGQEVKVIYDYKDGSFDVEDKTGKAHVIAAENLELLNNIIEEGKGMKFKVGDIVTGTKDNDYGITNKDMTRGEVVEVYNVSGYSGYEDDIKIKVLEHRTDPRKVGASYPVESKYFKLVQVADQINATITFDKNKTVVTLEDGSKGTAKLYYKDTYNKGYGIAVALGRALGIDLVDEVIKVHKSYETASKTSVLPKSKFKVGDLVRGISDYYGYTDKDMTKGEVLEVLRGDMIRIKILEHKSYKGDTDFAVDAKDFELIEEKLKVGDYVYSKFKYGDGYFTTQITKIENEKVYGFWYAPDKVDSIEDLPKTISEFDKLERSKHEGFIELDLCKKLILLDDIKEEIPIFKIGDRVKVVNVGKGLKGFMEVGDTGIIKSINSDDVSVIPDKDTSDYWYVLPSELELVKEIPYEYKIGDKVVPHSKTAVGFEVRNIKNEGNWENALEINQPYLYVNGFDKDKAENKVLVLGDTIRRNRGNFYLPSDVTLYVEAIEETPKFKVGDKVKLISTNPKHGFGSVKTGDTGKIVRIEINDIYVDFKIGYNWHGLAEEFELVEELPVEVKEEIKVEEFTKGDKIYRIKDGSYQTLVGIFDHIESNKVWANWNKDNIHDLPKTIKEFNDIKLQSDLTYVTTKSSCKKLVLQDDTKLELKVGDKVTKEQAIEIIEAGGKIKDDDFIYFKEDEILKFKEQNGNTNISGGYENNLNGRLTIAELPKQKVNKELLKKFEEGEIVFHATTEEDANRLLKYLDSVGFEWCSGTKLTSYNNFGGYDEIVYEGKNKKVGYGSVDFYKGEGKEIATIADLFGEIAEEITTTESKSKYTVGQKLNQEEIIEVLINGGKVKRDRGIEYFLKDKVLYYISSIGSELTSTGIDNIQHSDESYTVSVAPEHTYQIGDEVPEEQAQELIDLGFKLIDADGWTFKNKKGELVIKGNDGDEREGFTIGVATNPIKVAKLPKIKIAY